MSLGYQTVGSCAPGRMVGLTFSRYLFLALGFCVLALFWGKGMAFCVTSVC